MVLAAPATIATHLTSLSAEDAKSYLTQPYKSGMIIPVNKIYKVTANERSKGNADCQRREAIG